MNDPIEIPEERLRTAALASVAHLDAEAGLLDELAYVQSILDTIREPLLVLDQDLRVKTASRSFFETFGVSPADTIEQLLYALGDRQWNIPALRNLLSEVLPQEKILRDFEVRHTFPGLGERIMLLNARRLWRPGNNTARILLAFEDVTERKRMQEGLLRSNEDLQRFAYVAAHDLRSPLNSAMRMSRLLQKQVQEKLDSDQASLLSLSIDNLQRLSGLMEDILTFSTVAADVPRPSLPVSAREALEIALANLRHHIEEAGASIVYGELPTIRGDRTQIAMLFQNLVGNALKFRRSIAPRIELDAIQEGSAWRFSVRDNGQGFDIKYALEIFEPFKRLHGHGVPGSGIGLASCRRIVERLGGKIWAASTPGVGSTFFFILPQDSHSTAVAAPPEATAFPPAIEAELAEQWRLFDTALSHTPDFTYIIDLQGRFTYANRALLSLWQIQLEQAVGKNFVELNYPLDLAERLQRQVQEVVATRAPLRDQTPFTGPSGETRHYEYIFVPVLTSAGEIEAVAGSTRDITERKRIEEALAISEARLQQVFAQAPVAIIVFRGPDFVVELANPPYQALLNGRELVGRRFADVVPELGPEVWEIFKRVIDTGEPYIASEWNIPYDYDSDGISEDHYFNVVYHPLRESDETISGFVAVLAEVTPQVRARQELETLNRDLEEFAYVAGHDLQEPLRAIGIYSQMILKGLPQADAKLARYGEFVRQGVTRMDALLNDLLTFSSTIHKADLPAATGDLSQSLEQALEILQERIQESGAKITSGPLPRVRGDQDQLRHVFQNLVSNSMKYSRPGVPPEISIAAVVADDTCTVSVRDNGIGFQQQYAKRIFGLFKRLHKDQYPGTGLGLAICKRIVERYGGLIWAHSTPGEGATFYFSLPAETDYKPANQS